MSRFFGRDVGRIDANGWMFGRLVWIGYPGELFDDTGARLGVESLSVPLLTDFERCGNMDENVSPKAGNKLLVRSSDRGVRSDRGTNRDPARLRDFRRNVSDTPDVQITVLFAEA